MALDVPLDECFDFLAEDPIPAVGALVVVPFGHTRKVGVVVEHATASAVPAARLKAVERIVEDVPPIDAETVELLRFCAAYYQRPWGEVVAASLPPPRSEAA